MNKKKILQYGIGPIGAAAVGFITIPIITWFYSIEDVGRISMLQVVVSFSILLFCLGLDQAYVREYYESKDKPSLLKVSILPGLFLMSVCYSLVFFINPTLISKLLYDTPSSYLSIVSIVCFILAFLSRFLSLILRMEERALAYSMSQLLPKVLFLLFILSTVLFGFKQNIYNLIAAQALSITMVFLVFSWNTKQEWFSALENKIDYTQLRKVIIFGSPLIIGGLASWGLNVMDKIFLRSMSTFEQLGIYAVTISITGAAAIFAGIFNTIWTPLVYKWVKEGVDLKKVDEISYYLLAIIYFVIVLSGLFSWVVLYFLPKQYSGIEYLIPVCLLAPLLYTLSETTAVGITIARKTYLSMVASVCAMLVNAFGNYMFVPDFGAAGAAVSTAFSFYIFLICRTEFSSAVWRDLPKFRIYSTTFLCLASTLVYAFLGSVLGGWAVFFWFILLMIGLCIYSSSIGFIWKQVCKWYLKKKHTF